MTNQIQLNLDPQSVSYMTHPELAGQFQGLSKDRGVGGSPMVGMILPLISMWIHPASQTQPHHIPWQKHLPSVMAHNLWSVLLSESKQIHLLPITVSLTEFLQWDIGAWASLGPEARHHVFWPGSSPRIFDLGHTWMA